MYALIENNVVVEYPASVNGWRRNNPNVSLPAEPTDAQLEEVGLFVVHDPGRPAHDPWTQSVDAMPPAYVEANSRWELGYAVRAATPEEITQREQQLIDQYTELTQRRLDTFAQTRNYDGILSACTYATSPTAKFAAEGQYCVAQRDATWAALLSILNDVRDGLRAIPTWAEVEAELPVLEWPAN